MSTRSPIFDDSPIQRLLARGNLEFLFTATGSEFGGADPTEDIGQPINLVDGSLAEVSGTPTIETADGVLRIDHVDASDKVSWTPANDSKALFMAFKVGSSDFPIAIQAGSQFRLGNR